MQDASSRYARRAWGDALEQPVGTNRVIDEITVQGGGPVQRELFPPRYGYDRSAASIKDVIDVDDIWRMPRDTFFTGGPASISSGPNPSYSNTLGNV